MSWSLAKAKDNFSEVIRRARAEGPQPISVHGKEAAVVLSAEDYHRLRDPEAPRDFKAWLLTGPTLDDVEFDRDPRPAREVDPF